MGRVLAAAAVLLAAVAVAVAAPRPTPAVADAAGVGGDFVPFATPGGLLNTADGTGGVTGVRGPASTTTFPALGVAGVPATGVSALLVRLYVSGATASTFLEIWPDGTPRAAPSMLAVGKGENLSNTAVVKPGANGKLAVYNNSGNVQIGVDVQGYFRSGTGGAGGGFVPVTQTRLVDTRSALGTPTGTIAAGASRTVTLTGGVIPAGAAAVYANLLVPGASAAGWVAAAPAGTAIGRGVLNYVVGSTDSGAALKLSADGKVTLTNKGSAAINLVVSVSGYFAATSTQGAGLRPLSTRLINTRTAGSGLPVPANGTLDVQVGGITGLPTRGIAGVVVNVTVTPAASGYLQAWPAGEAAPTVTLTDFNKGIWRSNLTMLRLGTDGKIRIKNGSSGTAHIIVDLHGWYADPLPSVPVSQFAPTSVLQGAPPAGASLSMIEYAYVDNIGRVVSGHQSDPDNFNSVQWTVTSGNEALTGQPALVQLADSRVQVAVQHTNSNIWASSQTDVSTATWKPWSQLGGSVASSPAMARLSTGTPVVFAVDVDGKLWAYAQTGSMPYWQNLGDQDLVGTPVAATVNDGVQVFGRDSAGAVRTIKYGTDGATSAWTSLGGTGATGVPSVVLYPGYRLRVFVRSADGTIVTKLQDAAGGTWPAAWTPVGTQAMAGSPAAILDPVSGCVSLVARGTDNRIYLSTETAQGSGVFQEWKLAIEEDTEQSATDPTVAPVTNSNGGQGWIIVFRNLNNASKVYHPPAPSTFGARSGADRTPTAAPAGSFRASTLPAPPQG